MGEARLRAPHESPAVSLKGWLETIEDIVLILWFAVLMTVAWLLDQVRRVLHWCVPWVFLLAVMSCVHPRLVPMVRRPDTRRIRVIHLDSAATVGTLQLLQAALPNEGAVCYTGQVYDSTMTTNDGSLVPVLVLMLNGVTAAPADSATRVFIFRPRCSSLAIGHSHPYNAQYGLACDQSDEDSNWLFNTPQALVSLAWCGDGVVQFLWQDGRRGEIRWRPE